ncbi:MAG: UTP--glucose-1-phosphate uridylyltransferase GalU [Blastocatellia bacterium]
MQKVRKAIFPAAGLGTRFLPATKVIPKEMLTLVDKPLIQYGVEEAINSGIENIVIITGRGKYALEDHFDTSFELEHTLLERGKEANLAELNKLISLAQFSYVRQRKALGLGHAVLMGKNLIGDEPFAVILPDDVVDCDEPCLKQMIEVYQQYQAPVIAVTEIEGPNISRFGVIAHEKITDQVYKITDMVEKPPFEQAPSKLAIIGRYILTPDLFPVLEQTAKGTGGEIQLTDAMKSLLAKRPFYACKFNGKRHDGGDKLGFLIATIEFALKRKEFADDLKEYLKTLSF